MAADHGGVRSEETRGLREPWAAGIVRGVCGIVCVTEHSRVVAAVDSGDWAGVIGRDGEACRSDEHVSIAGGSLLGIPSANAGDRVRTAGASLARSGDHADLLDRSAQWQAGR